MAPQIGEVAVLVAVKIAAVLGAGALVLYGAAQWPRAELSTAEVRCVNIARDAAPIGRADTETYMAAYRACKARQ